MRTVMPVLLCLCLIVAACDGKRSATDNTPSDETRYLAIVDARGDGGGKPDQFHLIDTVERKLLASFDRDQPDGVFLSSGATLLLGGGETGLDWIEPADWRPTRNLKTGNHGWWLMFPEVTQYALSPDGQRLYVVIYHPEGPGPGGVGRLAVQAVDLSSWKVLEPAIEVPPCGGRVLSPPGDRVYYVCLDGPMSVLDWKAGKEIRRINVGKVSYNGHVAFLGQDTPHGASAGEFLTGGGQVIIIGSTGVVLEVDPDKGTHRNLADLDFPDGHTIPHRQAALSPDGKLLFVGTAAAANKCRLGCSANELVETMQADTVRIYDTATWEQTRSYSVELPFASMAITAGGSELLLVNTTKKSVLFVDSFEGTKLADLGPMGNFPSMIIGPPSPLFQ